MANQLRKMHAKLSKTRRKSVIEEYKILIKHSHDVFH